MKMEKHHGSSSKCGFTLIEILIASGLMCIAAVALYTSGIQLMKLVLHNKLSMEVRALGLQKMEEIIAGGYDNVISPSFLPVQTQTNTIFFMNAPFPIIRSATLIGHAADRSEIALGLSEYVEIHVDASYISPFTGKSLTNSYSTLIARGQ